MSSTFLAPFTFSKNFDYSKYIEERSHFDHLAISVDKSIRETVVGLGELSTYGASIEQVGEDIDSGFERISFEISGLSSQVSELSTICEVGFYSLKVSLDHLQATLDELLQVSKSPEQTWSNEQFGIARKLLLQGMHEESLSAIDMAIDGNHQHTGYKLDPEFYHLRGLILQGNDKNTSSDVIDLTRAEKSYLTAAKLYARSRDKAGVFLLAGWCSAFLGNRAQAQKHFRSAVLEDPTSLSAQYALAKACFASGDLNEGRAALLAAISGDVKFAIMAGGDNDILGHKEVLESIIQERRSFLIAGLEVTRESFVKFFRDLSDASKNPRSEGKLASACNYAQILDQNLQGLNDKNLVELAQLSSDVSGQLNVIVSDVRDAEAALKQDVQQLQARSASRSDDAGFALPFIGALVGILIAIARTLSDTWPGWNASFFDWIAALVTTVIVGAILILLYGAIGGLVGWLISLVFSGNQFLASGFRKRQIDDFSECLQPVIIGLSKTADDHSARNG